MRSGPLLLYPCCVAPQFMEPAHLAAVCRLHSLAKEDAFWHSDMFPCAAYPLACDVGVQAPCPSPHDHSEDGVMSTP